jgi:serine/threonine-protein kinase
MMKASAEALVAGRFRVLGQLGTGGLGPLYRALDRERGEEVALRTMATGTSQDVACARLATHIRALSGLADPAIARVFDCGLDGDLFWMSEELVAGRSLERAVTERGPLSALEAAAVASEITRALQVAHAQGLLHRDLKPRNVFFDGHRVKVLGLGVSAAILTWSASLVASTPGMMPPEQTLLQAMDHRADVYSLGALLFFALVGEPPFKGGSDAVMAAQLGFRPPRPRDRNANVPEGLELVILRAMAKRREDRYQSMAELEAALASWRRGWSEETR